MKSIENCGVLGDQLGDLHGVVFGENSCNNPLDTYVKYIFCGGFRREFYKTLTLLSSPIYFCQVL
jgi:hypothetical protein